MRNIAFCLLAIFAVILTAVCAPHRAAPYVGLSAACETWQVMRGRDGKMTQQKVWKIVQQDGAQRAAYPASVTKLMTLLLVMEDVRAKRYTFNTPVVATADVNCCEPSWVGLKAGDVMTVRDLLLALMVESANDAAIALGVNSAGSFEGFVTRMNARASALGMAQTKYYNPNGLPPNDRKRYPWKNFNVTTAADQMKLAMTLVKIPETLFFTSVKTCDLVKTLKGFRVAVTRRVNQPLVKTTLYPGETIIKQLRNHNNVMVKDKQKIFNADGSEAIDGLKTGYINAGGSSIVLTGQRGGLRAIVVVLGSESPKLRDENAARVMTDLLGAIAW